MKIAGFVFLVFTLFYLSCKTTPDNTGAKGNSNDTTRYFQVKEYLQSQIKEVDNTPFFIYKIDIINGAKDSTPINTSYFDQLSSQFLTPDINNEKLKPFYVESIFEDQTTKGFTINYSTTNKELELQSVDILLGEDGRTVKHIFLRKFINYADSSAIEQLSWKPGESFQVNRSVQKPGASENSKQTLVVWNKKI